MLFLPKLEITLELELGLVRDRYAALLMALELELGFPCDRYVPRMFALRDARLGP